MFPETTCLMTLHTLGMPVIGAGVTTACLCPAQLNRSANNNGIVECRGYQAGAVLFVRLVLLKSRPPGRGSPHPD